MISPFERRALLVQNCECNSSSCSQRVIQVLTLRIELFGGKPIACGSVPWLLVTLVYQHRATGVERVY
eukprot:5888126-Amphidinium_carterae.2